MRVCIGCGYMEFDVNNTTVHPHNPVLVEYSEPTCTEDGRIKIVCSNCNITCYDVSSPAFGHDLVLQHNSEGHWYTCVRNECYYSSEIENHIAKDQAICEDDEVCRVCEYVMGGHIGHKWDANYSGEYTSTHYFECVNPYCSAKNKEEAHIGGTATCTSYAVCDVCKLEYYKKPHDFSKKIISDEYIAAEPYCLCGTKYYYACAGCDLKGSTTYVYGAVGDHNWAITYSFDSEYHYYFCNNGCGEIKDKEEHDWSETYSKDSTHHWKVCVDCGYSSRKEEHSGAINECLETVICPICDGTYGPLGHLWSDYKSSATEHWIECERGTCTAETSRAEHSGGTATCTAKPNCGACGRTYGKALGHEYSDDHTYDGETHWRDCIRKCGAFVDKENHTLENTYEYAVVDTGTQILYNINFYESCNCGYKKLLGTVSNAEHYACELLEAKEPTCTEVGLTLGWKCAVEGCDEVYMPQQEIPALGHDLGIYNICTRCGYEKFSEGLEYTLSEDGTYYIVSRIGTCTDIHINIPSEYNEKPVKEIGNKAFYYKTNIISAKIPDSVTSIGSVGFASTGLTSVMIGDSVTSIGSDAFQSCTKLTSVEIPDSVTSIGAQAFYRCIRLTSVTIGNGVKSIGDDAFYKCSSLTSVTIPNSVTSIGDDAFYKCSSLTSVTIPNSVTSIGNSAFRDCSGLTSVTIGSGVTSIVDFAFYGCYKLVEVINKSSLTITKGTYSYGDVARYALEVHDDGESKIVNKNGYLFYTYEGVNYLLGYIGTDTELNLPANYNRENYVIYEYAFYDNDKITSVIIPNSVTSIGNSAFYGCYKLTSVTIPNNVTRIGKDAFCNTGYYNNESNWENGVLYIGKYLINTKTYISSNYTIKDGTALIADSVFNGCSSLTSVTICDSVTSIGNYAFANCHKLIEVINKSSLNITKGSTSNGYVAKYALEVHNGESKIVNKDGYLFYTYADVNYLVNYIGIDTELTLPENYNRENYVINKYAFIYEGNIISVIIPDSVTDIGSSAFLGCSLTSVTIGNGVTSIGESAFDCSYITSVYIDDIASWCNIKFANSEANPLFDYSDHRNLYLNNGSGVYELVTELVIPNSVTSIGAYAFVCCNSITSVTIADSVMSIGDCAFHACDNLTRVTIGNGVTSIGYCAFYGCDNLTSATIGNSVTIIVARAFQSCGLTSVTISDSVKSIGDNAFYNCTGLTSITIPDSVTSIGSLAFSGCSNLTSIKYRGTEAEWGNISKSSANIPSSCVITYNYMGE